MFFQNVGYRWPVLTDDTTGKGLLFLPSGNDRLRFNDSLPDSQRLFDPQLYLSTLDAKTCQGVCARLSSYPWFGVAGIPEPQNFEGKKAWQEAVEKAVLSAWKRTLPTDIKKACTDAIRFQLGMGCAFVILPAPLISAREDEAQTEAAWLDAALEAAIELDVACPMVGTVAISEAVLNEQCFESGGFLETVIDQLSSREGIDGVYIVIAQTHANHPFESKSLVSRAYVHLARGFSKAGLELVITNFADVLGLACIGAGGTGFATGPSQSLRRLSLDGFQEKGGGLPLPHFYSHKIVGELLSQTDMNAIRDKKLLRRVNDLTPYSKDLLDALDQKRSAADIAPWTQSKNNMGAAQKHFLARMSSEAERLTKLATSERLSQVRDWLEDADVNAGYLSRKLKVEGRLAPVSDWLEIFDEVTG